MKNKKVVRIIIFILILIWASLVFNMSNQQGTESSGLSRKITAIFFKSKEKIDLIEPYIRKIAHFGEYAIGGILFMSLFLTYEWSEKKQIITSTSIGIWYAILDEIHQLMVPERSGNIKDVWIDSLGILVGVFSALFIYKVYKKYSNYKEKRSLNNK